MAAVAVLGTSVFTTTAGNKTITATPTAGDLIVIIAAATGVAGTVGALSISDNNSDGLGTYTKINSTFTGFSTAGGLDIWIRNALIGSATSTVFTATQTSSTGGGLVIYRITGMSIVGQGAVRGAGGQSTGTAGTTPAPVLLRRVGTTYSGTQAALTGNPIVGAIANGTSPAGLTPPASFTEAPTPDLGYSTPPTGLETVFVNSGITASTITWGGTSLTAFASMVVELDASVPQYDYAVQGRADKDRPIVFLHANHVRASFW
jgi:hypothetical protein